MDKSADGCNPALYVCRPRVLDYQLVHPTGDFHPPGKDSLISVGGARHLWLYVLLLAGIEQTTPVSSSIFSSLQPIWVFILSVIFFKETITKMKITGILIGLGGALLCILTQKNDDLASDAFTGNLLCLLSSMAYAIYLIASNRILKHVGVMTMLRYTFPVRLSPPSSFPDLQDLKQHFSRSRSIGNRWQSWHSS